MSTIPSTFNEHEITLSIIGGIENNSDNALDISVILLSSDENQFKTQSYENLLACNFKSIISIEKDVQNFAIYEVNKKYPEIKFIIPQEKATDGELINIAAANLTSKYFLVLRDNIYIPGGIILKHLADRLVNTDFYCIVPRLLDNQKKSIPCTYSPIVNNSKFAIDSSISAADGGKTLYPFDFIALYNRQKFINLGGFDYTIQSPYWQNLDLAIRSWLCGEETKVTTSLQFTYAEESKIPDTTVNMDYLRFYVKNQLPKIKNEAAYISNASFLNFYFHSRCGIFEARKQFDEAKKWIKENKYIFKMDLFTLVKNWS